MKNLLTSLILMLFVSVAFAQIACNADFNFSPDPSSSLLYNFQHQSTSTNTPVGSGYFYRTRFYFGDGSSQWDTVYAGWPGGFSHYYNNPGVYALLYELDVIDSANGNVLCTSYKHDTIRIVAGAYCNASFASSQTSSGSLVVSFQNTSYTNQSSMYTRHYDWDFGDGNRSTSVNPTHAYANSGSYQVTLFAYALDTNGIDTLCYSSMSQLVKAGLRDSCGVDFNWYQTNGTMEVNFQNLSYAFAATATTLQGQFKWYFGDGSQYNGASPSHTYAMTGNYNVKLVMTVTDSITQNVFCSDSLTQVVIVSHPTPQCVSYFSLDSVNSTNGGVFIYNNASPAINDPNLTVSHSWDFGDGTTSTQAFPSHTYQGSGPYNVCLTVTATDSLNYTCTDTYCRQVGIDSLGNVIYKSSGFTLNVLDPGGSVGQMEYDELSVSIYPNPAKDFLSVEGAEENIGWVLHNLQGALVLQGVLQKGETRIDLGAVEKGLYTFSLLGLNFSKHIKLYIN